ncbi:MAG: hypothetical protein JKY84_05155 [Emcibacteraceae bacterium]|nr:hypothetical protein [Emcibacteraceae bacterium]
MNKFGKLLVTAPLLTGASTLADENSAPHWGEFETYSSGTAQSPIVIPNVAYKNLLNASL